MKHDENQATCKIVPFDQMVEVMGFVNHGLQQSRWPRKATIDKTRFVFPSAISSALREISNVMSKRGRLNH